MRWCWVLGLVACGTLRKPPEPDRRLDVKTRGALFESDNGYRFAALPEPNTGVIRFSVRYPVGWTDDPAGKEGLAHLVEHLLFEVEIERDGKKTSIGAELSRIALWSNAVTTADYTSYEALVAPEQLDELVRLEVDRVSVGCAGLTKDVVAREREVVINELRQRQGAHGAELAKAINEAVFPAGHPYRSVSSVDSVARLQLEDVCGFLVGPYRRGKVIVVASGMVDRDALQAAAGRHLSRVPKRNKTATAPVPPAVTPRPDTVKLRGDVDQTVLLATWPLPPQASRDYRMLEMAWRHMPSRLEAFGLTYGWGHSAFTDLYGGAHAPVLAVGIALRSPGDLGEAKSAAAKAAEYALRVLYRGGDERDTPRWIAQWRSRAASVLARWESLATRNDLVADMMQYETDDQFLVGRIDELVKAHPKSVRDIAAGWLDSARARFVLVEPSGPTASVRKQTYAGGREAHAVYVDASLADRALKAPSGGTTFPSERYTTSNGLSVVLWPHGASPLVHGQLVVDSGYAHEPPGKEGISAFIGANRIDEDALVFTARELSIRVDDLVASLGWELRQPGYELEDEVKGAVRGQLKLARAKERRDYQQKFLSALYGDAHPYARTAMTEDSLDNISRDSVMSWARDHIVPANAVLVVAGKFDPALVKKHIAYNTDQVSRGGDSQDANVPPTSRRDFIPGVAEQDSPTVAIEVGFVGGSGIDRDHAKRLVLAAVLTTQLAQLRAKRALSYGFSASYDARTAGGLWLIAGESDATRAAEAATAIVTILEELRANPDAYRTAFVLARQKVLEELVVNTTSSSAMVSRLAYLARFDLPDDFYETMARSVAALTITNFHPFLVRELSAEGQVFGAFGNATEVGEAIRAAKAVQPAAPKQPGLADPFE